MKKMMILMLALALGATTAFAQDKKCCKEMCGGEDFAVKRTERIAQICKLDDAQKAAVLELNQGMADKCRKDVSAEERASKAFKKEMKAEKKAYDKSLKKIIGKKNFRNLKGCDKVVCKAVKLNEKIASQPVKEKKSKKK